VAATVVATVTAIVAATVVATVTAIVAATVVATVTAIVAATVTAIVAATVVATVTATVAAIVVATVAAIPQAMDIIQLNHSTTVYIDEDLSELHIGNLFADKQTFAVILQIETAVLQSSMRGLVKKC